LPRSVPEIAADTTGKLPRRNTSFDKTISSIYMYI
jgi:hypothetical protein